METRYILSADDLKANGLIHQNVEVALLTPILLRVQDRIIQQMLGTALYVKVLDLIQAYDNGAGSVVPAPYKNLIDKYIIPCMIPHVEMRSTTFLTWRMRNAGTGTFNDQYFKTSTRQEVTDLKQLIEGDCVFYDNELITHLRVSGKAVYPEYVCGQECEGGHDPEKKKRTIGNFTFIKGGKTYGHKRKNH